MTTLHGGCRSIDLPSHQTNFFSTLTRNPKTNLNNFQGLWSAKDGSASTVPNTGLTGSAIDATVSTLNKVKGPAFWFKNVANNNFLIGASVGKPADCSFDLRAECSYTLAIGRPFQWNIYLGPTATGIDVSFFASDATFYGFAVLAAAYSSFVINGLIQYRLQWDPVSDTLYFYARSPGTSVLSDAGWNLISSQVFSGKEVNVGATAPQIAADDFTVGFNGQVREVVVFVNGTKTYDVSASSIPTSPSATSFIGGAGETWNITRTATGPATTIVPAGRVAYINPDSAVAGNKVAIPDNAVFDVAVGEDCVFLSMFYEGNQTAAAYDLSSIGTGAVGPLIGLRRVTPASNDYVFRIGDGVAMFTTPVVTLPVQTKPVLLIGILDRTAVLLKLRAYDETGLIQGVSVASTGMVAIAPATALDMLSTQPGSFVGAGFKKGTTIAPSDAECLSLAKGIFAGLL